MGHVSTLRLLALTLGLVLLCATGIAESPSTVLETESHPTTETNSTDSTEEGGLSVEDINDAPHSETKSNATGETETPFEETTELKILDAEGKWVTKPSPKEYVRSAVKLAMGPESFFPALLLMETSIWSNKGQNLSHFVKKFDLFCRNRLRKVAYDVCATVSCLDGLRVTSLPDGCENYGI